MDAAELDRFILETVEAHPEPPRPVDRGPLLVHCTLNLPSAVMPAGPPRPAPRAVNRSRDGYRS